MKITKTQLKQMIKEEIKSNAQGMPLKEYGGFGSVEHEMKITNELLTKILDVLSHGGAPVAEPMD
jgi:hypothetical protein